MSKNATQNVVAEEITVAITDDQRKELEAAEAEKAFQKRKEELNEAKKLACASMQIIADIVTSDSAVWSGVFKMVSSSMKERAKDWLKVKNKGINDANSLKFARDFLRTESITVTEEMVNDEASKIAEAYKTMRLAALRASRTDITAFYRATGENASMAAVLGDILGLADRRQDVVKAAIETAKTFEVK